jgi:hypothetical protein
MASTNVPYSVTKRVIEHPQTGLRHCANILAENEAFVVTSSGTHSKSHVHGSCHAPGSHGNSIGAQYQQVTGRVHTGGGIGASTGYTQAQLKPTPGTTSGHLANAGVFYG